MKFHLSLVAFLTFSSSSVLAAPTLSCPDFTPRPFSLIETEIDLRAQGGTLGTGEGIDCAKVAVGAKVVMGIQRMLGRDLPAPSQLIFRMVDTFDNAFFDPSEISLNVPYKMMMGKYSKNPVFSIPVWAHEFGHAVLDKTLSDAAPKWRAIIKRDLKPSAGSASEVLSDLVSGYHEFFADVIAVLYTEEGDSVARALSMTGFSTNVEGSPSECPNSDPKCRPRSNRSDIGVMLYSRDFTDRRNQLNHWRGVKPGDDHNLLAPARFHIWKYYLANPRIYREKGKLAATTVDAIISDLNRRLKRLTGMPGGITSANLKREMGDVVRVNAEFIDTLDATFEAAFQ